MPLCSMIMSCGCGQQCWEVAAETADEPDSKHAAFSAAEFVSQLSNCWLQLCAERLGSAQQLVSCHGSWLCESMHS